MHLLSTIRVALRALGKNKMRAGLTVLGVVIGVAAVTTMVSVGQSAGNLVQGELQGLGTNVIVVFAGSRRHGGVRHGRGTMPTLVAADAYAMARECPALLAVSPIVVTREQVIYGNTNWSPREMVGVGTDFLTVRNWQLRTGGFFTEREVTSAAKVCVIGQTIVEKLFQTTNPLGKQIRIKNIPFRVIGVLEAKGANIVGEDQDNVVLAPYTTVRKRLRGSNFDNVDVILASARSVAQIEQAEHEIELLLSERHKIDAGDPPDFEVQTMTEIANMLGMITGTMTAAVGLDRRHLAGRGRRRHHEHHARLRYRTDARDRHSHGRRRPAGRHPAAVPGRIGHAVPVRRPGRVVAGHRRVRGNHVGDQFVDQRDAMARGGLVSGGRLGHRVLRRRGRVLRLLSRPASQPARPDRRPAVRVSGRFDCSSFRSLYRLQAENALQLRTETAHIPAEAGTTNGEIAGMLTIRLSPFKLERSARGARCLALEFGAAATPARLRFGFRQGRLRRRSPDRRIVRVTRGARGIGIGCTHSERLPC